MKCGDANPFGNISLFYKGGCKKEVEIEKAYRCVGCGGWFHYECILKHFEMEAEHDNARNALRNIKDYVENNDVIYSERIEKLCQKGLEPNKNLLERSKK